jgi:hypothetical protein
MDDELTDGLVIAVFVFALAAIMDVLVFLEVAFL